MRDTYGAWSQQRVLSAAFAIFEYLARKFRESFSTFMPKRKLWRVDHLPALRFQSLNHQILFIALEVGVKETVGEFHQHMRTNPQIAENQGLVARNTFNPGIGITTMRKKGSKTR